MFIFDWLLVEKVDSVCYETKFRFYKTNEHAVPNSAENAIEVMIETHILWHCMTN
jgi:hypothetical protein